MHLVPGDCEIRRGVFVRLRQTTVPQQGKRLGYFTVQVAGAQVVEALNLNTRRFNPAGLDLKADHIRSIA